MDKARKTQIYNIVRIIGIALLLLIIFKGVFLLVLLIGLSFSMSYVVNNLGLRKIGIELVTFVAVVAGLKYGPWVSLLITFVLITYHLVMGGFLDVYVFWVIPAYCLAAIISGFLPQADVVQLGIYASIAINANNTFFTAIRSPGYLFNYMIYVTTNIIFNVIVFTLFGKPMLLLIR